MTETIRIGDYVEGYQVKTNTFTRGYLTGYALCDKRDPDSIVAEVAKNHSKTVYIVRKSMKLVSRYETLLEALKDCGLQYVDGKIVGCHQPKFCAGDIVRHKSYGESSHGNAVITYVSETCYNYCYQDHTGGGSFPFSIEDDYIIIN